MKRNPKFGPGAPSRLAVSIAEAAWMMGVSVSTVKRLIAHSKLKSSKVGRRRVVRLSTIDACLDGGCSDAKA